MRRSGSGTKLLQQKEIAQEKVKIKDKKLLREEIDNKDINISKEPNRLYNI